MRYQNWDVLVFPDLSKIPQQEFKTACQVIQDQESHISQINPHLLPTVTSFIPGLPAGEAFRISIHSWENPDISRYALNLKKTSDIVMFEARVFIDGTLAGSKWFDMVGPWPTIIDLSIDLNKDGEFEKLKFPTFHKELLSQSYWNAGDDLGRIKVVIAEGFSRDNLAYPFDRVKNIVSFSFQHAPLDVLESSSIAWPNASMWRQVSLVGPYYSQAFSPRQATDVIDAHGHSPRHVHVRQKPAAAAVPNHNITTSMFPPPPPTFSKQPVFDPFTESVHPAFNNHWRQASSADVSMPDYSSSNSRAGGSRNITDPMIMSEKPDRRYESMQMPGAYESMCEALAASIPAAPKNTPQDEAVTLPANTNREGVRRQASVKMDAESIAKAVVGAEPSTNVKGRKENIQASALETTPKPNNTEGNGGSLRKVSQTATESNHNKRQRVVTPAASKVIDDTDEPRSSPSLRKVSGMLVKQDSKEGERKVLQGIENV